MYLLVWFCRSCFAAAIKPHGTCPLVGKNFHSSSRIRVILQNKVNKKKADTMGKEDIDLESVYVTYWERLQHSLFLSFLLVAAAATTAFIIIALAAGHVSSQQLLTTLQSRLKCDGLTCFGYFPTWIYLEMF